MRLREAMQHLGAKKPPSREVERQRLQLERNDRLALYLAALRVFMPMVLVILAVLLAVTLLFIL